MANGIQQDDMGQTYLMLVGIAAAAACFVWYFEHPQISYLALKWGWYQLAPFDALHVPHISNWRSDIAKLASTPAAVSLTDLLQVLNRSSLPYVALPVALALRAALLAHRHPALRTKRPITANTLPRIMAKHSPAVIPVLQYGDLVNTDPPEQRSALHPEEWAALHGLVVNGRLDRDKCQQILIADLGKPIKEVAGLSPAERALFAVFGARLFEPAEPLQSQQLLDALNRSCECGSWEGKPGYPDLALAQPVFDRLENLPEAREWLSRHPYPRTLLHAMHRAAIGTGKLPSSHFRWLKGMDRPLWYALNTTGRKAPFIESAAVFTQTLWESFAHDLGYRLTSPAVDDAVDGLEAYLAKIGLISPPQE